MIRPFGGPLEDMLEHQAAQVSGDGMRLTLLRQPNTTTDLASLLDALDRNFSTGWRALVLTNIGGTWVQRELPRRTGHSSGTSGPEGYYMCFDVDEGARPTPQEVCALIERFKVELTALFVTPDVLG